MKQECAASEHGTSLLIKDLVKKIAPQTAINCREYLQSIYRVDLKNNVLNLKFQDDDLLWDQEDIDNNLLKDSHGQPFKRTFEFEVNGKTVKGWAGILARGGRKYGGFSLIQADRVIVGFPKSYKNSMLFGTEEGGRNDLVNQRLVGELELDENFAVSHTKDQILFGEQEEEELDSILFEKLADYKKEANIPFKKRSENEAEYQEAMFDFDTATNIVIQNLSSPTFHDVIMNSTTLPLEIIQITNDEAINRITEGGATNHIYELDGVKINIILSENSSPYDPYLIVRPAGGERSLNILININHPYWIDLGDNTSRFHFLLNCIYDGVAQWKAEFLLAQLDPDTIKMIKDSLLRLELSIKG